MAKGNEGWNLTLCLQSTLTAHGAHWQYHLGTSDRRAPECQTAQRSRSQLIPKKNTAQSDAKFKFNFFGAYYALTLTLLLIVERELSLTVLTPSTTLTSLRQVNGGSLPPGLRPSMLVKPTFLCTLSVDCVLPNDRFVQSHTARESLFNHQWTSTSSVPTEILSEQSRRRRLLDNWCELSWVQFVDIFRLLECSWRWSTSGCSRWYKLTTRHETPKRGNYKPLYHTQWEIFYPPKTIRNCVAYDTNRIPTSVGCGSQQKWTMRCRWGFGSVM